MLGVRRGAAVAVFTVASLIVSFAVPAQAQALTGSIPAAVSKNDIPDTGELSAAQAERIELPGEPLPVNESSMPSGDFSQLAAEAIGVAPVETTELRTTEVPALDASKLAAEVARLPVVERDETSTTYKRADGSLLRQVMESPLNVKLPTGKWAPISQDLALDSASKQWRVGPHPLSPRFADRADSADLVTVNYGKHEISYGMLGVASARAEKTAEGALQFREVQPGVHLQYEVDRAAVSEVLTLDAAPKGEAAWSWMLRTATLEPVLSDVGEVSFRDAEGTVQFSMPAPVAWDSSGVAGKSSDALINPRASLERVGEGEWRYSIVVDRGWLAAKERVYPVSVDPTIYPSITYVQSFKSDGPIYQNQSHVGNTRQNNQNVYWRAINGFNYGNAPGYFIAGAQIAIGYAGTGTTTWQGGGVYYATGLCYACAGSLLATYSIANGSTQTTGPGVAQQIVSNGLGGNWGTAFLINGNEGGVYSHKRIDTGMWLQYWSYPVINQSSPGNGATGQSLMPTLSVSSITGSEADPWKANHFAVSTNADMSNPLWVSVGRPLVP